MRFELYYEPMRYFASFKQWLFMWNKKINISYPQETYVLRMFGIHFVVHIELG